MKMLPFLTLATVLTFAVGCEVPESNVPVSDAPATSDSDQQESKDPTLFGKEDWYLPDGRVDMTDVAGEPPMTTEVPREVTAKDPKQGKLSRKRGGALGSVVENIPKLTNDTLFEMIKYNLNIYDADKGHFPKSHQEFMEDYLPNYYPAALPLPELEPGDEYIYDPADHLLKIYRPEAKTNTQSNAMGTYIGDVAMGKFFAEHREDLQGFTKAVEDFKNEQGRYPESDEEFVEKVLQANQIQLPQLEAGRSYRYDPETETLKIYQSEN